jgi:hypothetical protein
MESENFKIEATEVGPQETEIQARKNLPIDLKTCNASTIKVLEANLKKRAKLFENKLFQVKL